VLTSCGIGAAIAKRLAADGANVAVTYIKGADAAAAVLSWTEIGRTICAVIRRNSIRTEHLCNQQLFKPRTKLWLEAIQNVTVLHRAEKADGMGGKGRKTPDIHLAATV